MPPERRIHPPLQHGQCARVEADQMRREFPQSGSHTFGISRQLERAERTDLAVADQPAIGRDADDRAVEYRDGLALRQTKPKHQKPQNIRNPKTSDPKHQTQNIRPPKHPKHPNKTSDKQNIRQNIRQAPYSHNQGNLATMVRLRSEPNGDCGVRKHQTGTLFRPKHQTKTPDRHLIHTIKAI